MNSEQFRHAVAGILYGLTKWTYPACLDVADMILRLVKPEKKPDDPT